MHILLVEDDNETASYLMKGLKESGHVVDRASDGKEGLFMALDSNFDALIIDRMLPQLDGLTLITKIREKNSDIPIIILSALGEVDERVKGLKYGADDYLAKPFSFSELLARLDAVIRRNQHDNNNISLLELGDLKLDLLSRRVEREGQIIDLQPREYKLLEFLLRRPNQVVTRTMLLEGVWEYHFDPQTNVIDVHISRLRQKIDKPFEKPILQTIRGDGYMIKADPQ